MYLSQPVLLLKQFYWSVHVQNHQSSTWTTESQALAVRGKAPEGIEVPGQTWGQTFFYFEYVSLYIKLDIYFIPFSFSCYFLVMPASNPNREVTARAEGPGRESAGISPPPTTATTTTTNNNYHHRAPSSAPAALRPARLPTLRAASRSRMVIQIVSETYPK